MRHGAADGAVGGAGARAGVVPAVHLARVLDRGGVERVDADRSGGHGADGVALARAGEPVLARRAAHRAGRGGGEAARASVRARGIREHGIHVREAPANQLVFCHQLVVAEGPGVDGAGAAAAEVVVVDGAATAVDAAPPTPQRRRWTFAGSGASGDDASSAEALTGPARNAESARESARAGSAARASASRSAGAVIDGSATTGARAAGVARTARSERVK